MLHIVNNLNVILITGALTTNLSKTRTKFTSFCFSFIILPSDVCLHLDTANLTEVNIINHSMSFSCFLISFKRVQSCIVCFLWLLPWLLLTYYFLSCLWPWLCYVCMLTWTIMWHKSRCSIQGYCYRPCLNPDMLLWLSLSDWCTFLIKEKKERAWGQNDL